MKKSDLNESILGRKCVVYADKRALGRITELEGDRIRVHYDEGSFSYWHYKAVHLLKKKESPIFLVSEDVFKPNDEKVWGLFPYEKNHDKGFFKVKLVKIKE